MTRWWRNAAMWRDKLAATKFAAHVRLHEGGRRTHPQLSKIDRHQRIRYTDISDNRHLYDRLPRVLPSRGHAKHCQRNRRMGRALAKGFATTFKEMLGPTITENYPIEPAHLEGRYRGVHVLRRDEDGLEKCVACFLCAAACPANCIYIEAAETPASTASARRSATPRCYNIDYNRCIFAAIAWKPAPATPLPTATILKLPPTTPIRWSTAKSNCCNPCPLPARPRPNLSGRRSRPGSPACNRKRELLPELWAISGGKSRGMMATFCLCGCVFIHIAG